MQTARMTILMTPDYKAAITRKAALRGVSSSEHIRDALNYFDGASTEEEEALAALATEIKQIVPEIRASLDRSSASMEAAHLKVDAVLRELGVRT